MFGLQNRIIFLVRPFQNVNPRLKHEEHSTLKLKNLSEKVGKVMFCTKQNCL